MRMPWRSPSDLRAPQGDPKTDPPGRGAKKDKSTREWDRQPPPSCDWRRWYGMGSYITDDGYITDGGYMAVT